MIRVLPPRRTVRVRKATGELEEFDPEKLKRSLIRAGADQSLADEVVSRVQLELYDGVSTRELLDHALRLLRELKRPGLGVRYDLKRAIMRLGPTGYPFEKYVARILEAQGYRVIGVGVVLRGRCVEQEVDIAVEGEQGRIMVECKFHNEQGVYTDLKPAMYTHARFLDLRDHFDKAWLFTNTRFTTTAARYASCVGLMLTGWDIPRGAGLRDLVDSTGLYPVTTLDISEAGWRSLVSNGIVTLMDVLSVGVKGLENAGLDPTTAKHAFRLAEEAVRYP